MRLYDLLYDTSGILNSTVEMSSDCDISSAKSLCSPVPPHTLSPSDHGADCRNFPHCFPIQAALSGIIQAERLFFSVNS